MITRRNFLKTIGILGVCCTATYSIAKAAYDKATIFLTDFGGLIVKPIKGFVHTTEEAQKIAKSGGVIHPRGTGHSVMGKSLKQGATIFKPKAVQMSFNNGIVTASAGATLLQLDNYLAQYGYMVPSSPDHRDLSLGGVISVGGYGVDVCKYGPLVDYVLKIDLMTLDGVIHKGIPVEEPLAKAAICGIGRHGTILSAEVRCVQRPTTSFIKTEPIESLDFYVGQVQNFLDSADDAKSDVWYAVWSEKGNWLSRGATFFDDKPHTLDRHREFKDYRAFRKKRSDEWVFRKPFEYYIWSDHFVKINHLKAAISDALEIKAHCEENGGTAIIYSSVTRATKFAEHFPHYSDADYVISSGIFANFLKADKSSAQANAKLQMAYSKKVQEKYNGKPYRYGWEWQEDFKEF